MSIRRLVYRGRQPLSFDLKRSVSERGGYASRALRDHVGEVLGLTVDRIDLEHRLVTIDGQAQRVGNEIVLTTPKGEKPRTIKVPSPVALELRRHLGQHARDDLLFLGGRGAPMRRQYFDDQALQPALEAAGLADAFVFHALRHWCASSMLAEGVKPMAVAGDLGDTLETLQRTYAHWLRDDRDVPADALERMLAFDRPAAVAEGS